MTQNTTLTTQNTTLTENKPLLCNSTWRKWLRPGSGREDCTTEQVRTRKRGDATAPGHMLGSGM